MLPKEMFGGHVIPKIEINLTNSVPNTRFRLMWRQLIATERSYVKSLERIRVPTFSMHRRGDNSHAILEIRRHATTDFQSGSGRTAISHAEPTSRFSEVVLRSRRDDRHVAIRIATSRAFVCGQREFDPDTPLRLFPTHDLDKEAGFAGIYEPYCTNTTHAADVLLREERNLSVSADLVLPERTRLTGCRLLTSSSMSRLSSRL
jgi:hypothetical protein